MIGIALLTLAPSGGAGGVVERKNMAYTYAWYYLPPLPVKLP